MSAAHTPMVVAAARALCKRASEVCGVDEQDNWNTYGYAFMDDAQAVLDAAGAHELLEALELCLHAVCLAGWEGDLCAEKARAAIAKATGGAQ